MAGLFDDVPDAAPVAAAAPAAKGGGLFDDVPDAAPASAASPSVAADVAQSAGAGIIRGAAGLADLPQTLYGLADAGAGYLAKQTARGLTYVGLPEPASDRGVDTRIHGAVPSPADLPHPGATAVQALEDATGKLYQPQTAAGRYAGTITEFVPGAGGAKLLEGGAAAAAKAVGSRVVAPAVVSETAGEATKGTAAEPWARAIGALVTGAGLHAMQREGSAERAFDRAAGTITPEEFGRVQSLVSDAKGRGVDLTWPEALQQVVGPRRIGDLLRVVEGQGGLQDFFAARPDQIKAAGQAGLDTVGPVAASPTRLADDVHAAATAGVASTPEGQGVIRATQAAGPRVTPDQAGQVIQRQMRGVADAREATRAQQAATDYDAARAAPERVGIDRTVTVERPGEPVVTPAQYSRPQFTDAAPRPLDPPPTVESQASAGPESLGRFIARNGGLPLEGDVTATDLHRFNIPGLGNVARSGGKSIDNFWRERLIEEGYFRPDADGGMARDISSELLRKLQNEQRGYPSYPMGAERVAAAERSRPGQVQDEYRVALSEAESRLDADLQKSGVDPGSLHPDVRSRTLGAMMRGETADPLDAYERVVNGMREGPEPFVKGTTVQEEISAPRFGQVDPQPALDALDRQIRTAKGDVRSSLEGIRRDLYENGTDPTSGVRETDLSVEGLLHARERIDQHIEAARTDGDATKVRDLTVVRSALDGQLKQAPEVATADANFAANSRPLDAFGGDTPLGQVTARNDLTGRMGVPAEQVPGRLEGATATRELLANATPAARRAFQDREVTRILDTAGRSEGGLSVEALRRGIRDNEDVLAQLPEARGRLSRLAHAYAARETIMNSPLGRLAKRPDLKGAFDVLFPTKPVEGTAAEIGEAVSTIARSNPVAARQVVRSYLGTEFAEATQRLQSGPNQAGGAKFAAKVQANGLQSDGLRAAIQALPNGAAIDRGFSRLMEIFEATGQRQVVGSRTSFNNEALAELKNGGATDEVARAALTGGFKIPTRVLDQMQAWRLGKNLDRLAELMTSVEGGRRLAQLSEAKPGAATIALLDRMVRLTAHGAQSGEASAGPVR